MSRREKEDPPPDPPIPEELRKAREAREDAYAEYLKAKEKASKAMTAYLNALWSEDAKAWRCARGVWLTGREYTGGWSRRAQAGNGTAAYTEVKFADLEDRHLSNILRRERAHPISGPALLREAERRGWVDGVNPKEEP